MPGRNWNGAEACRAAAGELAPVGPQGSGLGRPCSHLPAAPGLSQPRSLAAGPAVPGAGRPWAAGRGEWVFEGDGERQAGGSGCSPEPGAKRAHKAGEEETSGNLPAARGGPRGGMSGATTPARRAPPCRTPAQPQHPAPSTRPGWWGPQPMLEGDTHGDGLLGWFPFIVPLFGLAVLLPTISSSCP